MMRSVEIVLVIIIITGAFIVASSFASLPEPRQVSPVNLRRLSLTTLQALDSNHELSRAAFWVENDTLWSGIQVGLSASLPPNVIYNLTVYNVTGGSSGSGAALYTSLKSISNAESLGASSDASSYFVASSNVTFDVVPEKIGEHGGGTLYILNCSDANGWWVTGYTAQTLANDLYKMLSPYFVRTVMVQNTSQFGQILNGASLQGETVPRAVIINTCGEAVPIPMAYCQDPYSNSSYARYCYFLGQTTNQYNWTWCSIVGYPFYYASNTAAFSSIQNTWGIYGMQLISTGGCRAFLQGLDNQSYHPSDTTNVTDSNNKQVTLSQSAIDSCNYYGIYPSSYQTATRALGNTIVSQYNLNIGLNVFNPSGNYLPGTLYTHGTGGSLTGSFLALGLTRTPDVRITGLSLLSYYRPRLYSSEYTAYGTSRLIVLQLGLVGGV
jgi:hypothetical protein